jgi:hypothetical protein
MDMKISLKIFFAAILFFTLAAPPLRAQINPPIENGMTNTAATNAPVRTAVDNSQDAQSPPAHINIPGIHIGGPSSEDGEGFTSALALMIPIIAIVMGCGIPIVIVGLSLYFRHRKNKMLHETVRAMVDKGVPIPPEMFQKTERDKSDDKRARNDLRTGLMLTGIGIGVVLFIGKPGWIILFLGVAFLVIASLEKKDKNNDQPPKQ